MRLRDNPSIAAALALERPVILLATLQASGAANYRRMLDTSLPAAADAAGGAISTHEPSLVATMPQRWQAACAALVEEKLLKRRHRLVVRVVDPSSVDEALEVIVSSTDLRSGLIGVSSHRWFQMLFRTQCGQMGPPDIHGAFYRIHILATPPWYVLVCLPT